MPINRRSFMKAVKSSSEQYSDISGNKFVPVPDPKGSYSRLGGEKMRMAPVAGPKTEPVIDKVVRKVKKIF